MSIESAKAFIERMKTDEVFAHQISVCANAQGRMALVKAAGFDFTAQEINGVTRDLTDEELDRFTAGWTLIDKAKDLLNRYRNAWCSAGLA